MGADSEALATTIDFVRARDQIEALEELPPTVKARALVGVHRPFEDGGVGWVRRVACCGVHPSARTEPGLMEHVPRRPDERRAHHERAGRSHASSAVALSRRRRLILSGTGGVIRSFL